MVFLDSSLPVPDGHTCMMEELHHFHQLYTKGWLGRSLTEEEHTVLESEVVRRLIKSGLEIFDPR